MFSPYRLERIPQEPDLQAWNAADELLLNRDIALCAGMILILNDSFGALGIALSDKKTHWWNDSAMSYEALQLNCTENHIPLPAIEPALPVSQSFNTVILHLPKSLNFFAWQLEQIQKCLTDNGTVLVLGMVKHISKGHIQVMERFFSKINPGRSEKKARVIHLSEPRPHSESKTQTYTVKPLNAEFSQLPGCFAENTADPGALVFLDYLKKLTGFNKVLDLGCGNGILSYALCQNMTKADITLVDESRQALESARINLKTVADKDRLHCVHSNGTNGLSAEAKFDLIICNPPFHQGFTLTESIAVKLFADAQKHLAENGEFWVVANRHLAYFPELKKRFNKVALQSNHSKFNVYCCQF